MLLLVSSCIRLDVFEEPATVPETQPSAAGRKSGGEQKAGREGARHKDRINRPFERMLLQFVFLEIVLLLS